MHVTYTHVQRAKGVRALVCHDGREVGTIRATRGGFYFQPGGGRAGPVLPTIGEVKRRIESEANRQRAPGACGRPSFEL